MPELKFGEAISNYGLRMNFNPIIETFNLRGNYILHHWQAKPFGYRNFGYLIVENSESIYKTIPWGECKHDAKGETLQIDETKNLGRVPTAVILFENSTLIKPQKQEINKFTNKPYSWLLVNLDELPF